MSILPSGPQISTKYTLTGPDGTKAVFNDSTDVNFVGYLTEVTGLDSPEVRENAENIAGADGGIHGNFFYGRRPITLSGSIINIVSAEDRNKRIGKLLAATNAMRGDAKLEWTPDGGEPQILKVRRQQPVRVTGGWAKDFQVGMVAADPRIYAVAESSAEVEIQAPVDTTTEAEPTGVYVSRDNKHVYAVDVSAAKVQGWELNQITGELTLKDSKATGVGPSSLVEYEHKEKSFIIVANKTAGTIQSYSRNKETGVLTSVATKAVGTEPIAIYALNPVSGFCSIKTANFGSSNFSALPMEEDGKLGAVTNTALAAQPVQLITVGNLFAIKAAICKSAKKFIVGDISGWGGAGKEFALAFEPVAMWSVGANQIYMCDTTGRKWAIYTISVKVLEEGTELPFSSLGHTIPIGGVKYVNGNLFVIDEVEGELYVINWGNPGYGTIVTRLHTGSKPQGLAPSNGATFWYATNKGSNTIRYFQWTEPSSLIRPSPSSSVNCENKGTMETFPTITIPLTSSGEITNPFMINRTTGGVIQFEGTFANLALVELNFKNKTVTVNGVNAYNFVNVSATSWWLLASGPNEIAAGGGNVVAPVKMLVKWNNAWI